MNHSGRRSSATRPVSALLGATLLLSACATAPLTQSGALTSYAGLQQSDGVTTKTKQRVERRAVLAARTARLVPTAVAGSAAASGLTAEQLALVSNAIDRALCSDLSRRLIMVGPEQPADIVVAAVITSIAKTDTTAAGASVVTSIGGQVAGAVTGIPLPVPRLPIGMGSLSVEGEAKDQAGRQVAALVWARGADALMTKPRVAEEGDAHTLAAHFASDFAKLIVVGSDPIADPTPLPPTLQGINEYLGAEAKHAACRQFGRNPGLGDTLGSSIGLPPSWTDGGPKKN